MTTHNPGLSAGGARAPRRYRQQLLVRPLRPERADAEAAAALFGHVLMALPYYNEAAKAGERAKYTVEKLAEDWVKDPYSVLVAEIGGKLAGFLFSHLDDGTVWLSWFGVAEDCRQLGVGRGLLNALDQRAKNSGAHKIWCDSRTTNEQSKRLLSSHGYSQLCTINDHWYRQDFILWAKPVG